jgi:hypothetical protein
MRATPLAAPLSPAPRRATPPAAPEDAAAAAAAADAAATVWCFAYGS